MLTPTTYPFMQASSSAFLSTLGAAPPSQQHTSQHAFASGRSHRRRPQLLLLLRQQRQQAMRRHAVAAPDAAEAKAAAAVEGAQQERVRPPSVSDCKRVGARVLGCGDTAGVVEEAIQAPTYLPAHVESMHPIQ